MRLRRVATNGYAGLADAEHALVDAGGNARDLVVVTGPAASGKSSLLEAIASGAADVASGGAKTDRGAGRVRPDAAAAKITLAWELSADEALRVASDEREITTETMMTWGQPEKAEHDPRVVALFLAYAHVPDVGKLELFPDLRAIAAGARRSAMGEAAQRPLRTSRAVDKYGAARPFLAELATAESKGRAGALRARFDRSLAAFGVGRRLASADEEGVYFARSEAAAARPASVVELSELSGGEADAVLFAATAALIALDRSVVLVDAPELHVGCAAAAAFFAGLRALGQDNQLIVATASREILAAAPRGAVVELALP